MTDDILGIPNRLIQFPLVAQRSHICRACRLFRSLFFFAQTFQHSWVAVHDFRKPFLFVVD